MMIYYSKINNHKIQTKKNNLAISNKISKMMKFRKKMIKTIICIIKTYNVINFLVL